MKPKRITKRKTKYVIGKSPRAERAKFNAFIAKGTHKRLNILIVESLWQTWQAALPSVRK